MFVIMTDLIINLVIKCVLHSGKMLIVGHLCFGSTPAHNHCSFMCKTEENRLQRNIKKKVCLIVVTSAELLICKDRSAACWGMLGLIQSPLFFSSLFIVPPLSL